LTAGYAGVKFWSLARQVLVLVGHCPLTQYSPYFKPWYLHHRIIMTSSASLQHRCTIWQKAHLYRLILDSKCKCTFYCQLMTFPCKNLNLWVFYIELRLSLYKCVFCQIVQWWWGDSKLETWNIYILVILSWENKVIYKLFINFI